MRDLSACLAGGLPFLMAGDLNSKYVDWNSRLTTTSCKLQRDYAKINSSLVYGPDIPTTIPFCHSWRLWHRLNKDFSVLDESYSAQHSAQITFQC